MGNITLKTFPVSIGLNDNFGSFNENYTLNNYLLNKITVPTLNSA